MGIIKYHRVLLFAVSLSMGFLSSISYGASSTSLITVANGSFETPGSKSGNWAYVGTNWSVGAQSQYSQNSVPADTTHFSTAADGSWSVYLTNPRSITQNLSTAVSSGDVLSVTFAGGRAKDGLSTSSGGVFNATFLVGSTPYTASYNTTVQSPNTWQNYTLTKTITNSGNLSLMFSRVSGNPWLDNIGNIMLNPPLSVTVISPTNAENYVPGTPVTATATVAGGMPGYTLTYYIRPAGGSFTEAGSATAAPYTVSLGTPETGAYDIYATVTDSASTPVTANSVTSTFNIGSVVDFTTERWRIAEIPLTSTVVYSDPFQDVDVTATFTGPNGDIITRPAFWDGGTTWRVRFAPTVTGLWSMVTSCTDPSNAGLHQVTRTVHCNEYTGPHAIYQHGFLKVSTNGHYFVHADGTPFFYLGDTHWLFIHERFETSNIAGVPSQFKYTLDKRVAQGFTVFQSEAIHLPHGGTHTDSTEEAHCDLRNGLTEADLPGFANMDRKFEYIADRGLVHAHAGITWANEPIQNAIYTEAYMARLGRYWAARYGAFPVLWTVAQEIDPNQYKTYNASNIGLWYAGAQATADNDAYAQPLGAHMQAMGNGISNPAGSWWGSKPYHGWWPLQMQGTLSGHTAAKSFWQNTPTKPMVLYEPPYENFWTDAKGARGAGYKAFQWGMCGYGYGANGIWNDLYSNGDYGTAYEMPAKYLNWYDGANLAGGAQMTHLKNFYTALAWWKLTPRFDDSVYSSFSDTNNSFLTSDSNRVYVVYFAGSGNGTGTLKAMAPGTPYTAAWFNPRTGVYTQLGTIIPSGEGQWIAPTRPTSEDWVLLVEMISSTAATPIAVFTAGPTNCYVPLRTVFTDNSKGTITNRHWVFGDGNTFDTVSQVSVTNLYTNAGIYTVSLTVSGPEGAFTNTQAGLIEVKVVPAPKFSATNCLVTSVADGALTFHVECLDGLQYRLVYKDDLMSTGTPWKTVTPPDTDGWTNSFNGIITIQDPGNTGMVQRFYRLESKSISAP